MLRKLSYQELAGVYNLPSQVRLYNIQIDSLSNALLGAVPGKVTSDVWKAAIKGNVLDTTMVLSEGLGGAKS
eukprot:14659838-Ditylum_brightwellii.AAC.1